MKNGTRQFMKLFDGQYRVYIGLKYGVGDANRLAEYIVANVNSSVDMR